MKHIPDQTPNSFSDHELIVVAIIAIPIISWPGNTFKFVKHALEWDYFLGVILFYLLTFFMWKKINY